MQENLSLALQETFGHEGGLSMIRSDPGNWTGGKVGAGRLLGTKYGIAANSYPNEDIPHLTLTRAADIYRRDYWDRIKGDQLPSGVDTTTFDGAVNSGVSRGAKWLQLAVRESADGKVGPDTLAATWAQPSKVKTVQEIIAKRTSFLHGLSTWRTFGRGWAARLARVEAFGVKLATAALGMDVKVAAEAHAVTAEKSADTETNKGTVSGMAGATGAGTGYVQQSDPNHLPSFGDAGSLGDVPLGVYAAVAALGLAFMIFFLLRAHLHKARKRAYDELALKG